MRLGPKRAVDAPLRSGLLGADIECFLEACEGLVDVARDDLDPPRGRSLLEDSDEGVVHLADRVGMLRAVDQRRRIVMSLSARCCSTVTERGDRNVDVVRGMLDGWLDDAAG